MSRDYYLSQFLIPKEYRFDDEAKVSNILERIQLLNEGAGSIVRRGDSCDSYEDAIKPARFWAVYGTLQKGVIEVDNEMNCIIGVFIDDMRYDIDPPVDATIFVNGESFFKEMDPRVLLVNSFFEVKDENRFKQENPWVTRATKLVNHDWKNFGRIPNSVKRVEKILGLLNRQGVSEEKVLKKIDETLRSDDDKLSDLYEKFKNRDTGFDFELQYLNSNDNLFQL